MPFYFSRASSNGTRLTSADTLISPAPTYVKYPEEALGEILATADGNPVVQQGNVDGRVRAWVWEGYREDVPGYTTLWNNLLSLRARHLKEAGAVTPFAFLKETDTKRLRRRVKYTGNATATFNTTTLQDSGAPFPGSNALAGYQVYLVDGQGAGQASAVASNTSTVLTLTTPWALAPNATSKYLVVGWVDDFFQVRVVDVSRVLDEVPTNPPTYKTTTMLFTITDSAYNDLG